MIIVRCKPANETSPDVVLRRRPIDPAGDVTTDTFHGADIATVANGTAKFYYLVDEQTTLQNISALNASGNTDVSAYPYLQAVGAFDGLDTVILTRGEFQRPLNLNFETSPITNAKSSTGINAAESYLRYSYEWLSAMLDLGGSASVFTGENRNTGCWLAGEDLTGIPWSNTSGGSHKNSGMITPRHLPGVAHYPMAVGTVLSFKDAANNVSTRTIIGVSTSSAATGDAVVYVLNTDVNEDIKKYPVAGRWLFVTATAATFTTSSQFVGVFVNKNRVASFVRVCDYEPSNAAKVSGNGFADCITTIRFDAVWPEQIVPEFATYSAFRIGADTGDSGSAIFVPVAGGLALASCFTGPLSGPFWDEDFVNALIASADANAGVSTGYTVTVAPDPTL